MIIQQRINVLIQLQFYNVFTYVLSKVLLKMYNKNPKYCHTLVLTIIISQANSVIPLHQAFELYPINFIKNVP